MSSAADRFLPIFDVDDTVATVVDADAGTAWEALMAVDLIELGRRRRLVGLLGAARMIPQLLRDLVRGNGLPASPGSLTLRGMAGDPDAQGSWIQLEESDHELVLGLIGMFWRPVIRYTTVPAGEFADFDAPGWAKTVYALSATDLGGGRSLLQARMRTATTDDHSRRAFRRYWTFGVGSGAHVLAASLLDEARDAAQGVAPAARASA